MRKKFIVICLLLITLSSYVEARDGTNRTQYLNMANLFKIILTAKENGFTNEQLDRIELRDFHSKVTITEIGKVIDLVKERLSITDNELRTIVLHPNDQVVDLYDILMKLLSNEPIKEDSYFDVYTTNDVFFNLRDRERAFLNENKKVFLYDFYE